MLVDLVLKPVRWQVQRPRAQFHEERRQAFHLAIVIDDRRTKFGHVWIGPDVVAENPHCRWRGEVRVALVEIEAADVEIFPVIGFSLVLADRAGQVPGLDPEITAIDIRAWRSVFDLVLAGQIEKATAGILRPLDHPGRNAMPRYHEKADAAGRFPHLFSHCLAFCMRPGPRRIEVNDGHYASVEIHINLLRCRRMLWQRK